MSHQRVVVTGLGAVTPIGVTKDEYWQNLLVGRSGAGHVEFPEQDMAQYRTRIAAPVKGFTPDDYLPRDRKTRYLGKPTVFALAAARMAIEDAGLNLMPANGRFELTGIDPDKAGVILGAAAGNMDILERELRRPAAESNPRRFSPHALPNHLVSALPATVAMMFTCQGVNYVVSTSCTSSSHAIGNGFRHLQSGWEDIIIAGGADSGINPTIFAGFMALKAMSARNEEPEKACRPFDRQRDGFVMGEGAGIVILERLEHALARKASIYAEITGFGSTSDAYHLTAPDPEGNSLARAIRMALHEAGRDGPGVDYINAHGTATRFNDMAETRALKQVFGRQAYQIPISATKSMTGHLLGAAGGIEFIATVLATRNGLIPPTINYEYPDPECDLDYVPDEMREASIESAMSISLGFGGFNCALVISRYEPQ